ncbi:MAG: orotidine-5'-phosphate decarboxylase [Candidatus Coatesbacteria bacterium]|nr:orotidine-5'-phosphate decarboxylase [Candidatus Coatesbacteria bacterium]
MDSRNLFVALDTDSVGDAMLIVDALSGVASSFKIGSALYSIAGVSIVERLVMNGINVFLDLKFHDIPSVIAKACVNLSELGVRMMTLHTTGGVEMMSTAAEAVKSAWGDRPHKPLLMGVTILTSLDQRALSEDLACERPLKQQVLHLAGLAKKAGLDGVVASGEELQAIKQEHGSDLKVLVPGIRPAAAADDQKRTITPAKAVELGADFLVVGRPITGAKSPRAAAEMIIEQMKV